MSGNVFEYAPAPESRAVVEGVSGMECRFGSEASAGRRTGHHEEHARGEPLLDPQNGGQMVPDG